MAWDRRGGRGSPEERHQRLGSGIARRSFAPRALFRLVRALARALVPTDVLSSAQLLRMFGMFCDDNIDADFKYLHVFKRIDKCEKWAAVRRTLAKAKETYKPDAPTAGAADGRPEGNKGAKKAKYAESAAARVQESIEHCIANAKTRAAEREEKTEARWVVLMTNSAVKLDLLRTSAAAKLKAQDAKKRNNDLAFLMGGADMLQSGDKKLKAWFLANRGLILAQIPATPTPPPSPAADDDASATPSPTEDDASAAPNSPEAAPNSLVAPPTPPSPLCRRQRRRRLSSKSDAFRVLSFLYAELHLIADLWHFESSNYSDDRRFIVSLSGNDGFRIWSVFGGGTWARGWGEMNPRGRNSAGSPLDRSFSVPWGGERLEML